MASWNQAHLLFSTVKGGKWEETANKKWQVTGVVWGACEGEKMRVGLNWVNTEVPLSVSQDYKLKSNPARHKDIPEPGLFESRPC